MKPEKLKELAINSLEDLKAKDLVVLDVREIASFTDYMIIASGTSDRHLKAMGNQIHVDAKNAGVPPISTEGKESRDWVLVDLGNVIIHIMRPEIRERFELEKLWQPIKPEDKKQTEAE